jgi:poly-gamma-glutamate synthesis protein (capsule biosynthesis protein)
MPANQIKIILGGDVMLGRLVKEAIFKYGPNYPLGAIADTMRRGDLTIVNLECAITQSNQLWSGAPKAFYFGAPPEAADSLQKAGVDLVSLANNHCLDFDYQGLRDTFRYLLAKKIKYAGAGNNLEEALAPAILERKEINFGMVAFCDHQTDFAATANQPGMAYIDLENESEALEQFATALKKMQNRHVNYPILSLHWGPNLVLRPSHYFIVLAHKIIDMGYKMIFGHSAHVFQGIEIYKRCPIFYAAGDLVDDYYVDEDFKNNHQLLFEVRLNSNGELNKIYLYPVFIENFATRFAHGPEFQFISERIKKLSAEMGTEIKDHDQQRLVIEV